MLPPEPAPDELPETIAMVLDELDRMTRIIDDMAELAYMEDPASLRTGDVDLDAVPAGGGVEGRAAPQRAAERRAGRPATARSAPTASA